MSKEITISITQLEIMLDKQKELVIENLLYDTSYYNAESTEGCSKAMNINEERFRYSGMTTKHPYDFIILEKYLK